MKMNMWSMMGTLVLCLLVTYAQSTSIHHKLGGESIPKNHPKQRVLKTDNRTIDMSSKTMQRDLIFRDATDALRMRMYNGPIAILEKSQIYQEQERNEAEFRDIADKGSRFLAPETGLNKNRFIDQIVNLQDSEASTKFGAKTNTNVPIEERSVEKKLDRLKELENTIHRF